MRKKFLEPTPVVILLSSPLFVSSLLRMSLRSRNLLAVALAPVFLPSSLLLSKNKAAVCPVVHPVVHPVAGDRHGRFGLIMEVN